jgi:HEAT repeat protein
MEISEEKESIDVTHAKGLFQALPKARKNLRMYPANNPIYVQTVEAVYKKFDDFFQLRDKLPLNIGRNEIFYESALIFEGSGKDENLPLIFFRDGIRELTFTEGLKKEELQQFLEVLSVDFDKEDMEDDMVTLLWDKDFSNISYRVDETVLAEDDEYEDVATGQVREGAMEDDNIRSAYEEAIRSEDVTDVVMMPLSESDMIALAKEVEDDDEDMNGKFSDMLFDMLYLSDSMDEFNDVTRIMKNALEYYTSKGDLENTVYLFKRVKVLMDSTKSDAVKKSLSVVMSHAGAPALVEQITENLEAGGDKARKLFEEYKELLGVNAVPSLIKMLGELKSRDARKYVADFLVVLGKKDSTHFVKALGDDRWFVVRNMVFIIRLIGDRRSAEHLSRVVEHSDARVRREVLKALGELKGQGSVLMAQSRLVDPDQTVRVSAVRVLGNIGGSHAKKVLLDAVSEKRFRNMDFEEKKIYFDMLSKWREGDVVKFLTDILKKKPIFKRALHNDLKACAAFSLGLMVNKDSLGMLEKLTGSKNRTLSEYASMAVKRIKLADKKVGPTKKVKK